MTATPADVQAKLAAAVTELEKTIAAIEAAQAEVGQLVAPPTRPVAAFAYKEV